MARQELDLSLDEALVLGCKFDDEGREGLAEQVFRSILEFDKDHFHALGRLGMVLAKRGEYHEALYCFWRCLKQQRKATWILVNRGMVLGELGHYDDAISDLRAAIRLSPDNHIAHDNLGHAYAEIGMHEDAIREFDRAIALEPKAAISYHNKSVSLCKLGRQEEGLPYIRRALELDPTIVDARYNLGLTALFLEDYEEGFRHYEGRWDTREYAAYGVQLLPSHMSKWIGQEPIAGKSLLLVGDQGYGDMIMFSRYIPLVVAAGARQVHVRAPRLLYDLFYRTFSDVDVFEAGSDLDEYGWERLPTTRWRTALGSLPLALGTRWDTVPPPVPFVVPGQNWLQGVGPKIGICWSGNFKHKQDRHRSILFRDFAPLTMVPGVTFYSLQHEVRQEDEKDFAACPHIVRLDLQSFSDTAAVVRELDLVITVDTSVAHIAGSQGTPTWILLPAIGSDWRWAKQRTDTPWYPSADLIRQRHGQPWSDVVRRLANEITQRKSA